MWKNKMSQENLLIINKYLNTKDEKQIQDPLHI